jgi:hypothetical protein
MLPASTGFPVGVFVLSASRNEKKRRRMSKQHCNGSGVVGQGLCYGCPACDYVAAAAAKREEAFTEARQHAKETTVIPKFLREPEYEPQYLASLLKDAMWFTMTSKGEHVDVPREMLKEYAQITADVVNQKIKTLMVLRRRLLDSGFRVTADY